MQNTMISQYASEIYQICFMEIPTFSIVFKGKLLNIFFNLLVYPLPFPLSPYIKSWHIIGKFINSPSYPLKSKYNTFIYFKKQNRFVINQLYLNEANKWTPDNSDTCIYIQCYWWHAQQISTTKAKLPGAIWKWFLSGVRITDPELFLRLLIQQ